MRSRAPLDAATKCRRRSGISSHRPPTSICRKKQEPHDPIKKYNSDFGVNKHNCPYDGCAYATSSKQGITYHVNRTRVHTIGSYAIISYARRSCETAIEESRVIRETKKWGSCVDTNVTIEASRHGCLTDTERLYSRVDIVMLDVTSFAHDNSSNYMLSCELSRMSDINEGK